MCVIEASTEPYHGSRVRAFPVKTDHQSLPSAILYDPLHDDAQAMALVKKFRLSIRNEVDQWRVSEIGGDDIHQDEDGVNADLNRAICETVAKLQMAKGENDKPNR